MVLKLKDPEHQDGQETSKNGMVHRDSDLPSLTY